MNKKFKISKILVGIIVACCIIPAKSFATSRASVNNVSSTDVDSISYPLNKYLFITLNMDTIPAKTDTISVLYNNIIGILDYLNDESVPVRYIAPNPNYYRISIPMVYYNSPIRRFGLHDLKPIAKDYTPEWQKGILPFDESYFTLVSRTNKQVDKALMDMYLVDAGSAYTTEDKIMGHELYIDQILSEKDKISKKKVSSFFTPEESLKNDLTMIENKLSKPNWWHLGGEGSLQITQNYISPNWHKGGETNNSVLSNLKLFAKYDDRNRVQIENYFEAKLGFNTVPSDTVRSYRVNTDMLRFQTKIGIKASKSKWFYTISGEMNTQFSRNFKKNSTELMSAFMTPYNMNVSLGMDFKQSSKKVHFSMLISPVSYNFRYLKNKKVNVSNYGVKEGRNTLHDVGSKLDANLQWTIISSIRLTSKFNYFTNYSKVVAEWENTFDFVLNRYLSTKLFFHTRFDDSAKRIDGKSYLQFKELLSFGINYRW